RAKASDRVTAFLFFIIVIAHFSVFRGAAYPFWNRPEPFLILIGVLTIIAAFKLPKMAAASTIGVLAGLASGYKVHGALYAVPAALAVCGAGNTWKDRIGLVTLATIAAAIAFSFPFLAGLEGTVEGYRSVLLMTATHGISLRQLKENLLFSLILLS